MTSLLKGGVIVYTEILSSYECVYCSRLMVQEGIHDKFWERRGVIVYTKILLLICLLLKTDGTGGNL